MTSRLHENTIVASACILVIVALICLAAGEKANLDFSIDEGRTWQRHDKSLQWAPPVGLLRPEGSSSVFVQIPQCALTSSLYVYLWRLDSNSDPFALSWESVGCDIANKSSVEVGTQVKSIFRETTKHVPRWWRYVRERSASAEETVVDKKSPESPGRFAKYGLFILVAIAFALAHGIRIGLSDLHDEFQREEVRPAAGPTSARGRSTQESVHVTVSQTKRGARQRKRGPKVASSSSK